MKTKKKKLKSNVPVRKKEILEYYYMIPEKTDVKALSGAITCIDQEKVEIWKELDLMEVVLQHDSLIFQNAEEVFEDPLDLEWLNEKGIQTKYQISFDAADQTAAISIFKELLEQCGGMLCSDTETFEPIWTAATIGEFSS